MLVAHFLTLQSVDAVLSIIRTFSALPAEEIPLDEAIGRVLAKDIIATEDLPGFDRSVDSHVKNLRRKLEAAGGDPGLIETVYAVGYRLTEVG